MTSLIPLLAAAALAAGPVLSDDAAALRKMELDAAFRAVAAEADREFSQSVAFYARLKDERLAFERRQVDKRKALYDSLRGLDAARRKSVYEAFHLQENRERADFARRMKEQKAAFHREEQDGRDDARRGLKRRREAARDSHRGR